MKTYSERTQDILEKAEAIKKKRSSRNKKIAAGLSCSLAAVVAVNLAVFLPAWGNPDNMAEASPEHVIEAPETVGGVRTGATGKQAESYQEVQGALGKMFSSGGSGWSGTEDVQGPATDSDHTESGEGDTPSGGSNAPSGGTGAPGGIDKVSEYADWETDGVIEGDLLARNQTTAFYLAKSSHGAICAPYYKLQAYSLEEAPHSLGTLIIEPEEGFHFHSGAREIYLSEDGTTVTVLTTMSDSEGSLSYVAIYTVDAEDPHTMSVTRAQFLSGDLLTSRMMGGDLFIVSKYFPKALGSEKDYIPQFGEFGAMTCIPAEDIFLPACTAYPVYTVFSSISEEGEYLDSFTILSLADCICFTREACYMTGSHEKFFVMNCGPGSAEGVQTDLVRIPIAAGGKFGSPVHATFAGTVKDRYAMDCFQGTLRIAATVDGKYASLYILDAKTLRAITAAENFAPEGETILAATFEQNRVYICTSDKSSDPVYCFDLSDLSRITYKQSGALKGYSTELIEFTDGLFLGVGYDVGYEGATCRVKIELYDQDAQLVASYLDPVNKLYAKDRKSYLIDKERGLFGISTDMPSQGCFSLLRWDGSRLKRILYIDFMGENELRPILQGNTLFLFDGFLITRQLP